MTILLEVLCVAFVVAFCVVVWWPAAFLVVGLAAGVAAWNRERGVRK